MATRVAPPPQPPEPCLAYIEASVLTDLADNTRPRNRDAVTLLALFQKYQGTGLLWLGTSLFAINECLSGLYDQELTRRAVPRPRGGRNRRLTIPPHLPSLRAATQAKDRLVQTLSTTTDFLLLPDAGRDANPMWQLAMRLAEEAGIYAPDSVHVATAVTNGDCRMLISDDRDLLDKMDYCRANVIDNYRQQQFSMLAVPPSFNAYGVSPTVSRLRTHRRRPPAIQALNAMGFD